MIKKFIAFSNLIVASCCGLNSAYAIVDIESLRERAGTEYGLSSAGHFDLSGTSGNSDKMNFSLSGILQYERASHSNLFVLGSEYGETSGNRNVDKQIAHIRHTRKINKNRDTEVFSQWQQNEFTRLEERTLIGGGIRIRRYQSAKTQLNLGLGGFYENETTEGNEKNEIGRTNIYLSFRHSMNNGGSIVSTSYLQNKLDDAKDKRAIGKITVSVPFSQYVEVILSVSVEHDSRPPSGVKETDWSYKTGIGWNF